MNLTSFPHHSDDPKTEVTLPVGTHVLRLRVKDDAGSISAPEVVTINVVRVGLPRIMHIDPDSAMRGSAVDATIIGENLRAVTSVRALLNDELDDKVLIGIRPGGTDERLLVSIQILPHASLGSRLLEVETAGGLATVAFKVIAAEKPRIINLSPTWGVIGLSREMPIRIEGDHFHDASSVKFISSGNEDPHVSTSIRQATDEFIHADVSIGMKAIFGPRGFSVTTPAGTTDSSSSLLFRVLPGYVQVGIMALTLITAFIHLFLNFPDGLFILNALGYVALLILLYIPVQSIADSRPTIRWVLLGYTLLTIVLWLVMGAKQTPLEYVTKIVEVLLVLLLIVESRQS